MIKNVYWFLCKCRLFLSEFNETWIFLDRFLKNTSIPNLTKIRPVKAELFHAEEQTDVHMTKLIVAFRNFVNAPRFI
jgi:hypothetical protein